jgi:uncharacterized protein
MIVVVALFAASWLLLRLEGKSLDALGFNQPRRRFTEFGIGLLIMGAAAALQHQAYAFHFGVSWQLNPDTTGLRILESVRWVATSVLGEELLFRGYLLYLAIRFTGRLPGILISAAAFGIYHWFSFNVIGNVPMMVFVFFFTGAFGFMAALAFQRTGSLAAPIGLHLGWNLVVISIYSSGPLGKLLLVPSAGTLPMRAGGTWGVLIGIVLPLIFIAAVCGYLVRKQTPALVRA